MAEYLVLARKYRSTTFDEVVGQEPIARTLVNAITGGRIAHAYLFTGTRGVGKTTMARLFAKALNCLKSDAPTPTPCNRCDACVAISRGDDVDVVEIDGASNRGIDEIRELRANAIYRPARSRYKIYYIDEVHMLTKEAFNALLKTLEEPPGHVKFIFATTEAEKLPATILSRCQRFDFRNIPTRRIAEHLRAICKTEKVQVDDDALFRVARSAAGSMRDALSLLDQLLAAGEGTVRDEDVVRLLGVPGDERVLSIASAVAAGDPAGALKGLDDALASGVTLGTAVGALGETFRNLMVASACGSGSELIELPDAHRAAVVELAGRFSLPALVQAVGMLQTLLRTVRNSSVARALVEATLVRLAASEKFVDPASLLERLESLASGRAGPATGQKKNFPLSPPGADAARPAPARSPAAGASAPATGGGFELKPPAGPAPLKWEASWLAANWQTVGDELVARGQTPVAGTILPAMVVGFSDGVLTLGFDDAHARLREQCEGRAGEAVSAALSELAGRAIRCQFVAVAPGQGRAASPSVAAPLSTQEKNGILKDPAVQQAMSLFGGEVVGMDRTLPPAPSAAPTGAPADGGVSAPAAGPDAEEDEGDEAD